MPPLLLWFVRRRMDRAPAAQHSSGLVLPPPPRAEARRAKDGPFVVRTTLKGHLCWTSILSFTSCLHARTPPLQSPLNAARSDKGVIGMQEDWSASGLYLVGSDVFCAVASGSSSEPSFGIIP